MTDKYRHHIAIYHLPVLSSVKFGPPPSVSTNPASTNIHPLQVPPPTVPSFPPTGLNRFTNIGAEGVKLQPPPKYDGSVEGNACKEWIEEIEEMRAYMSYYEKRNVFADEKEKIDSAQRYLKDTTKRVWTARRKYAEGFPVGHSYVHNASIPWIDSSPYLLLHACADINHYYFVLAFVVHMYIGSSSSPVVIHIIDHHSQPKQFTTHLFLPPPPSVLSGRPLAFLILFFWVNYDTTPPLPPTPTVPPAADILRHHLL